MGLKVNIFLCYCLLHGIVFSSFNMNALFIILYGFSLSYQNFKVWQFTGKFPGKNFTFCFNQYSAKNFHQEINRLWRKHGQDKFVMWVGFERFVTVSQMKDIKVVLCVTNDAPMVKNYQKFWPWIGGNVIKSKEFSADAMVKAINDGPFESEAYKEFLEERVSELVAQQNFGTCGVINTQSVVRELLFGIVYEMAMGCKPGETREMFEASEKLLKLENQRIYSGWKQIKWLREVLGEDLRVEKHKKVLNECVKKVLSEKRVASWENSRSCLLDMLTANETLDYDEIVATLTAFIVLGYDRLSYVTCSALVELSKQDKTQKLIQLEAQLKSPESSLDKFLLESQRLQPVIAVTVDDGVPLKGYFIPPETSVFLYFYGTNRQEQSFENSESFHTNRKNLPISFELDMPMKVIAYLIRHLVRNFSFMSEKGNNIETADDVALLLKNVQLLVKTRK